MKVGEIRTFPARLLRLSRTNEGYPHLPQGVGHTHLIDGCLAILLRGRADQMNKPFFNGFLYMYVLYVFFMYVFLYFSEVCT